MAHEDVLLGRADVEEPEAGVRLPHVVCLLGVDGAGGRSQIAQVTTGVIVIVTLLLLTVPLSYMPNAVLSAVVFLIGIKPIDFLGMTSISRVRPGEFVVALITAATAVIVGVEQGIILAVILSLILVLMHVYRPKDRVIAIAPDSTRRLGPVDQPVQAALGLMVYAFGAELFYANASRFTEEVMSIVEGSDPPLRWFVLDAAAIGDLDYSGADTLRQIWNELDSRGTRMVLCSVDPAVRNLLDAFAPTEQIGAANIFTTLQEAVDAYPKAVAVPSVTTGPYRRWHASPAVRAGRWPSGVPASLRHHELAMPNSVVRRE